MANLYYLIQCSLLQLFGNCLDDFHVQTRSIVYTDNVKHDWRHTHRTLASAVHMCLA